MSSLHEEPLVPQCLPIVEKSTNSENQTENESAPSYQKVLHIIKPAFETRQFIKNRCRRLKRKAEIRAQKAEEWSKKKQGKTKKVKTSPATTASEVARSIASSNKQPEESISKSNISRAFGRQTWEDETLDDWVLN